MTSHCLEQTLWSVQCEAPLHLLLRYGMIQCTDLRVSRLRPLVLLVKVDWRQGRTLESKGQVMGSGLVVHTACERRWAFELNYIYIYIYMFYGGQYYDHVQLLPTAHCQSARHLQPVNVAVRTDSHTTVWVQSQNENVKNKQQNLSPLWLQMRYTPSEEADYISTGQGVFRVVWGQRPQEGEGSSTAGLGR